ncbi:MAG: copper chaperone, partial [Chitinophagaceae bacterium]
MKSILIILATFFSMATSAQVTRVSLQASGLTCSMCSNSINKALNTLDNVLKVDADIKTYSFEIIFKPGTHVDFDIIKKKVESAGFTVSGFVATINFKNARVINHQSVSIDDKTLVIENLNGQSLNGIRQVRILD